MRRKRLLVNTALLSGSSIMMSCIAMAFQAWLVVRIGTAGIGLFQLVCSVSSLAATLAISGIRFASTRLVAEEIGSENSAGIRAAMTRCITYGILFGTVSCCALWFLASPVGTVCIGDTRTVLSLRLSAFSMPCIAICASLSGYFTAVGRVWKPALVHLLEQLASIALVALFLSRVHPGDIEKSCAAVVIGRLAADILALLLMLAFYKSDLEKHYSSRGRGHRLTARMLGIALPLAASAYARSALSTVQHLLVPRGLKSAGYSADGALSGYGTIQGMVLPIVLFPSCIMSAAAELIVPELTEAQIQQEQHSIRHTVAVMLKLAICFSVTAAVFMFIFADMLGMAVYSSGEAGRYIRLLAPLVPVMYTDMAVDGCLKGLGQQMRSMVINIVDSLTGLLMVIWLLPRYGLAGYIVMIYFTEALNLFLSMNCLRRIYSKKIILQN